jgi:hypothetical protein
MFIDIFGNASLRLQPSKPIDIDKPTRIDGMYPKRLCFYMDSHISKTYIELF